MEKLLESKQRLEQINKQGTDNAASLPKSQLKQKKLKFENRHTRVTIYLLNSVYDSLMELRELGYSQTDLMNEAVKDLTDKYFFNK